MSKESNDELLRKFLTTATEDELLRSIRFDFEDIFAFRGVLRTHLRYESATKVIHLNYYDLKILNVELSDTSIELRKIALDEFRKEFGIN